MVFCWCPSPRLYLKKNKVMNHEVVLFSESISQDTTVIEVAVRGLINIHSDSSKTGPTSIYVRFADSGRSYYQRHGTDPAVTGSMNGFLFLGNNHRDSGSGCDGAWFLGECKLTRTVPESDGDKSLNFGKSSGYGQSSFALGTGKDVNGFSVFGNGGHIASDVGKIEVVSVGPHKVELFACKVVQESW